MIILSIVVQRVYEPADPEANKATAYMTYPDTDLTQYPYYKIPGSPVRLFQLNSDRQVPGNNPYAGNLRLEEKACPGNVISAM
jgi:hypothetical protein